MSRPNPADEIYIRGQVYSIKKIQKLYQKDTALYPQTLESIDNMWICPVCGEFHRLFQIRDKYCSKCGQKIKWPRRRKVSVQQRKK